MELQSACRVAEQTQVQGQTLAIWQLLPAVVGRYRLRLWQLSQVGSISFGGSAYGEAYVSWEGGPVI